MPAKSRPLSGDGVAITLGSYINLIFEKSQDILIFGSSIPRRIRVLNRGNGISIYDFGNGDFVCGMRVRHPSGNRGKLRIGLLDLSVQVPHFGMRRHPLFQQIQFLFPHGSQSLMQIGPCGIFDALILAIFDGFFRGNRRTKRGNRLFSLSDRGGIFYRRRLAKPDSPRRIQADRRL